jgi:hypothetical protein
VPLLASAAARLRGVAVADVCDIYGVRIAAAGPQHAEHHHAGVASHEGSSKNDDSRTGAHTLQGHCALLALGAWAPSAKVSSALAVVASWQRASASPIPSPTRPDAVARWSARLKHGPPTAA